MQKTSICLKNGKMEVYFKVCAYNKMQENEEFIK